MVAFECFENKRERRGDLVGMRTDCRLSSKLNSESGSGPGGGGAGQMAARGRLMDLL